MAFLFYFLTKYFFLFLNQDNGFFFFFVFETKMAGF